MTATTQKVRSPEGGAMVARDQTLAWRDDNTWQSATHDGHTTTFDYPASGAPRATAVTDWGGQTSTFAHTPAGRRTDIDLAGDPRKLCCQSHLWAD